MVQRSGREGERRIVDQPTCPDFSESDSTLKLHHQVELEDDETAKQRSSIDDEYAQSGVRDPKVCVTTSRDPSSRLKQFAKEMKLVVPNAQRINRGNHKVREMATRRLLVPGFPVILISRCSIGSEKHIAGSSRCV